MMILNNDKMIVIVIMNNTSNKISKTKPKKIQVKTSKKKETIVEETKDPKKIEKKRN